MVRHVLTHLSLILSLEDATVGFSQADWQELLRLHGRLDHIRFGNRQVRREPLQVQYLGAMVPNPEKPKRPPAKERRKPPPDPGYEKFQLRLW